MDKKASMAHMEFGVYRRIPMDFHHEISQRHWSNASKLTRTFALAKKRVSTNDVRQQRQLKKKNA